MMTVKNLRQVSVVYLLLPNLIFFYSWTRLPVEIIGIVILIYLASDDHRDISFKTTTSLEIRDLIVVGVTGLVLTILSGTGGYCYQTFDYWGHNVKFHELFTSPWPLRIPANGPVTSYYYGYYVVPALIFKLLGSLTEGVIVVWTTIGIALSVAWLYLALNKKIWLVLAAMCTGDFPHFVKNLLGYLSIHLYQYSDFGIEHWSPFENIFWVPNQIIPSLIIAGMFGYILKHHLSTCAIILPLILIYWWAIFPAFTLSVFVGLMILKDFFTRSLDLHLNILIKKYLLPTFILIPLMLFLISHEATPVSGFMWNFKEDYTNLFSEFAVNILTNITAFCIIYFSLKKLGFKTLSVIPFLMLQLMTFVLPIYRIGKVNDFLFRGMIPILMITGIYLFYPLSINPYRITFKTLRKSVWGWIIILILFSSCFLGMRRVWRAFTVNQFISHHIGIDFRKIPYDAYPNVYAVLKDKWSQQEANQYLGKVGSVYERYIAP